VKRRLKVLLGTSGLVLAVALAPIVTIETTCRAPIEGLETGGYKPLITDPKWQRDESRCALLPRLDQLQPVFVPQSRHV